MSENALPRVNLFGITPRVGIAGELVDGAQRLALRAMKAYAQDDHEVSVLHAGVSLERLAKWALASRNPVLIVDMQQSNKSFKHLLHLTGIKEEPASELRTVGLGGALDRLRDLDVFTAKERQSLQGLVDRRNGVIHVGDQQEGMELVLVEFINTSERILADRGEDRTWFWGDQLTLVDEVRAQVGEVIERAVHLRIEVARSRYHERVKGLAPVVIAALATSAMERVDRLALVSERFGVALGAYPCPACGCPALVVFDRIHWLGPEPLRTEENFRQLDCQVCAFEMLGPTEIAAVELDVTKVELPGITRPARGDVRRWVQTAVNQAEVELFLILDHGEDEPGVDMEQYVEHGEDDHDENEARGENYEP